MASLEVGMYVHGDRMTVTMDMLSLLRWLNKCLYFVCQISTVCGNLASYHVGGWPKAISRFPLFTGFVVNNFIHTTQQLQGHNGHPFPQFCPHFQSTV